MKVRVIHFESGGGIPNHPDWPLLIVQDVWTFRSSDDEIDPGTIESTYRDHGWGGTWRNGIYGFHHYHSRAHEVLGIARGSAEVRFGGPQGETLELGVGDAAVLPAGTGHKKESASSDLLVVGGYPEGQSGWDLQRADELDTEVALRRIREVPRPSADPVGGPLLDHWPKSDTSV